MPHPIVHAEIRSADPDAIRKFMHSVVVAFYRIYRVWRYNH